MHLERCQLKAQDDDSVDEPAEAVHRLKNACNDSKNSLNLTDLSANNRCSDALDLPVDLRAELQCHKWRPVD